MPISLPKELNLRIKKQIKKSGFASKSEYFRDLAREDLDRAETEMERKKYPEFYKKLDRDLEESMRQYKQGKYYGPFTTVKELRQALQDFNVNSPKKTLKIKK